MSFKMPSLAALGRGRRRRGAQQEAPPSIRPDVALVFDAARGEVAFALYDESGPVVRRTAVAQLRAALAAALSGHEAPEGEAEFLTVAPHFTEETAASPLGPAQLALGEDDLLLFMADAERTLSGTEEGEPYVPESAREPGKAWDFARTPSGGVTVTSAARASLDEAASAIAETALGFDPARGVAADEEVYLEFRCETLARAALRAQLALLPDGAAPEDERHVAAFFAVTPQGASVGLWSPVRGLLLEDAEPFQTGGEYDDPTVLAGSVAHALSNLCLRLSPEALASLGFSGVHCVWWSASPALRELVAREVAAFKMDYEARYATSYTEHSHMAFGDDEPAVGLDDPHTSARTIEVAEGYGPLEELAARGLLLGTNETGSRLLPPINLADSAPDRAAALAEDREALSLVTQAHLRSRLQRAAFFPLVVALGLLFGGIVSTLLEANRLENRLEGERQEKARLAPVAERRAAATEVMKWVGTYLDQVTELRRRQPASLSLLAELDARYPVGEDESFTVKSLAVQPNGQLEIQGLTKKDDAVIAFVTSLEYSPTDEAGRKLFENPVYELRKPQVGGINLPSMPAGQTSPFQSVQSQRPDVTAFTVRTTYTPLQRDSAVTPAAPKGGKAADKAADKGEAKDSDK